tara:strand:+ start:255 stop:452 length:198 start_codon:yes stop_codon:yes gene_type:complete
MDDTSGMDGIKICKETGELYYAYNTLFLTINLLHLQTKDEGVDEEDIPWDHVMELFAKLDDPPQG